MLEFINKITGTKMWVDETRAEEYKAAGHIFAAYVKPEPVKTETKPVQKRTGTKKGK